MDDATRIQQDRHNRFRFLKHLYETNRELDSRYIQSVAASEVGAAIGVSPDEGVKIATFLKDKGLIKFMAMGPKVGISHYGIEYIEEALEKPDRPTEFFPPVNVLMIHGGVHGSQIQQGTTASTQHHTLSPESRAELTAALEEARRLLAEIEDREAREDLSASFDTATAQLKRTSPDRGILTSALQSAKNVAEKVGAGLVTAKLVELARGYGLL